MICARVRCHTCHISGCRSSSSGPQRWDRWWAESRCQTQSLGCRTRGTRPLQTPRRDTGWQRKKTGFILQTTGLQSRCVVFVLITLKSHPDFYSLIICHLEMMKNGVPRRLKPKSQMARLIVMSSGGLSFFLFLQQTNNTVPFPSTDRTPAAGDNDKAAKLVERQ